MNILFVFLIVIVLFLIISLTIFLLGYMFFCIEEGIKWIKEKIE